MLFAKPIAKLMVAILDNNEGLCPVVFAIS
jgi:hypothetical protein